MQKIIVLGNCVAERLQAMLAAQRELHGRYAVVLAPAVHTLRTEAEWAELARHALECRWIFTQPLFRFGACNTDALRAALRPGQRLMTFSSPNFDAYFPDVLPVPPLSETRFPPPLEWHSRIILRCYISGVPVLDVAACYLQHPLFRRAAAEQAVEAAWRQYTVREQGVDLGTEAFVRRHAMQTPLFETWRHPADALLRHMYQQMLHALGVQGEANASVQGFGFNQWPIITRHHGLYQFPERAHFRVAGKCVPIEDAAAAFYTFYDFHPTFVAKARQALESQHQG